jgi:hypothetical protein
VYFFNSTDCLFNSTTLLFCVYLRKSRPVGERSQIARLLASTAQTHYANVLGDATGSGPTDATVKPTEAVDATRVVEQLLQPTTVAPERMTLCFFSIPRLD